MWYYFTDLVTKRLWFLVCLTPPCLLLLSLSLFFSLCGSIWLSMFVLEKQAAMWWEALWKSPWEFPPSRKGLVSLLLDFPGGSAGKKSACNAEDLGLIPGSGRSPGEGIGYLIQYSGLENSMDCIVHGVTKSQLTTNQQGPKAANNHGNYFGRGSSQVEPRGDCNPGW